MQQIVANNMLCIVWIKTQNIERITMYSREIDDYLKKKSYAITQEELEELQDDSEQLSIQLEQIENIRSKYHLWTTDGFSWNVLVGNR